MAGVYVPTIFTREVSERRLARRGIADYRIRGALRNGHREVADQHRSSLNVSRVAFAVFQAGELTRDRGQAPASHAG